MNRPSIAIAQRVYCISRMGDWKKVAAGAAENVWAIDSDNNPKWRAFYSPANWVLNPNEWPKAKEISAGTDGTVMIIDMQNRIQQSRYDPNVGATWRVLSNDVPIPPNPNGGANPFDPGPTAAKVSVLDSLRAMRVNADGRVWKKVTVNGDWLEFRWKVRMNQV